MTRGPDPAVSAAEILFVIIREDDPAYTANEIAEEFDRTRQWADNRLKSMEEDGLLESKNPGGRARFYWETDNGTELLMERLGDSFNPPDN